MSTHGNDVYGGNYPKAKRLALARSGGKCQLCGLRRAVEAHHWAWPDYPSGEEVQGHDLTALCKVCHELATLLRDWVGSKDADFDEITKEIEASSNFHQKRQAFSYWLFPEDKGPAGPKNWAEFGYVPIGQRTPQDGWVYSYSDSNNIDDLRDFQAQLHALKESCKAIKRQIEHIEQGRPISSPVGLKNATVIRKWTGLPLNANRSQLKAEYAELARQRNETIRQMKGLED